MYITGFLIITIQSNCIGMDCSRKLHTSQAIFDIRPRNIPSKPPSTQYATVPIHYQY